MFGLMKFNQKSITVYFERKKLYFEPDIDRIYERNDYKNEPNEQQVQKWEENLKKETWQLKKNKSFVFI
jgi:hypothetical protein